MKRFQWKKSPYICGGLTAFIVIVASLIFYFVVSNLSGVGQVFSKIAEVLLPFIVGLALAYLLAPVFDLVKKPLYKWFAGKGAKPRKHAMLFAKIIATIAALLVLVVVVGGLLSMVIPQAVISVTNFIKSFPEKSDAMLVWVSALEERLGGNDVVSTWLDNSFDWIIKALSDWVQKDLLPNIGSIAKDLSSGLLGAVGVVMDVVVGIIICVYTLNSKELFVAQAKKVTYALFKVPTANYIVHTTRFVDKTFGRYINGMLLDSLMVGIICFIACTILRIPYALLISAIVGAFNVVPIFGPITAGVIGTFFVMLENPIKALFFIALVLVIQQVDGNIIAPKILGDKTGLTSFWVVFAIVVGGGFFGLTGMILGVPAFAVIYSILRGRIEKRLNRKHFPDDTSAYGELWEIDEDTGELQYDVPAEAEEK